MRCNFKNRIKKAVAITLAQSLIATSGSPVVYAADQVSSQIVAESLEEISEDLNVISESENNDILDIGSTDNKDASTSEQESSDILDNSDLTNKGTETSNAVIDTSNENESAGSQSNQDESLIADDSSDENKQDNAEIAGNSTSSNENISNDDTSDETDNIESDENVVSDESLSGDETTSTDASITESGSCGDSATYNLYNDGTLEISGTGLIKSNAFYKRQDIKKLIINEGITEIGDNAFAETALEGEISFPQTLKKIYYNAFRLCTGLESVTINSDLTEVGSWGDGGPFIDSGVKTMTFADGCTYIPYWIGAKLPNLQTVNIPDTVTSIIHDAFKNSGLISIEIPSSVTKIEQNAFLNCKNLTSVTLNEGLQEIGSQAFTGTALTEITIPQTITTLRWRAFENIESLTKATFSEGITNLYTEDHIFSSCPNLDTITLPESLTAITGERFLQGSSISHIDFPQNLTNIQSGMFQDCQNLTSINIPSNIKTINNNAFLNCKNLTSVTLNEGLQEIQQQQFIDCTSLKEITIPASIKNLGYQLAVNSGIETINFADGSTGEFSSDWAFQYTTNLKIVNLPDSMTKLPNNGLFAECSKLETVNCNDSLKSIGANAFRSDAALTSINLPDGFEEIGDNAFQGCTGLTNNNFILPDQVTTLGQYVFNNCTGFTVGVIPASLQTCGRQIYAGCSNITSVDIHDGATALGPNAFYNNTNITEIYVPASLQQKEARSGDLQNTANCRNAFNCITNIKKIVYEPGSQYIAGGVDQDLNLEEVDLGGGDIIIGSSAFGYSNGNAENNKLTTIKGTEHVNYISDSAFCNTRALTEFDFGDRLTTIHTGAFYNSGLVEVHFPDTLKSIISDSNHWWTGSFEHCLSLEKVYFPTSVVDNFNIGRASFLNCPKLTYIYGGNNIKNAQVETFRISSDLLPDGQKVETTIDSIQSNLYSLDWSAANRIPIFPAPIVYIPKTLILDNNGECDYKVGIQGTLSSDYQYEVKPDKSFTMNLVGTDKTYTGSITQNTNYFKKEMLDSSMYADTTGHIKINLGKPGHYTGQFKFTIDTVKNEDVVADYTELEYVSNNQQTYNIGFIDTGYIPKANDKIVLTVKLFDMKYNSYTQVFGARNGSYQNNAFVLFDRFNGSHDATFNRQGVETRSGQQMPYDEVITITAQGQTCQWTGQTAGSITTTGTVNDCINTLFLMANNTQTSSGGKQQDSGCYMNIYSCQIYNENGNLVRDMIPVHDNNTGYNGLYDKVQNTMHLNYWLRYNVNGNDQFNNFVAGPVKDSSNG